jgi:hypothetical protein
MSEQKSEKAPSVANLRAMREKVATQDAEAASRSRTNIPVESRPTSESPRFGEKAQPGSFFYYDSETAGPRAVVAHRGRAGGYWDRLSGV